MFKRLSATNPTYRGQLKSTRILLAAMNIVRESRLEGLIIDQINNEDMFESVRVDGMPGVINERRALDRREEDRRSGDRRMGDRLVSS